MGKFKKVSPGELSVGDTVWIKAQVDYVSTETIDVSMEDGSGSLDWTFGVPLKDIRVKESKDNMSIRNKTKVLTGTAHKTIIRHGELENVLTGEEYHQWQILMDKILEYDKECENNDKVVKK